MGKRLAWFAGAAWLALAAPTWAAAPAAAPADAFDAKVAAAKAAMMGDPAAALARAGEALAVVRAAPATGAQAEKVATAEWLQGEALVRLNRLSDAAPIIDRALADTAARAPASKLRGDLLTAQAEVRAMRGDSAGALAGFQSAYRIFGQAHQPRSQAMALMHIGSIYQDAGDFPKVLEYYAQAADLYPADPALLVTADNNIGRALKSLKRYGEAVAAFQRARQVARQMGSPQLEAQILTNEADAELARGRIDAAQQRLDEDLAIAARDPGARDELPFIWGVAAQAQLQRHDPHAAAALIARTFQGQDLTATAPAFRDFHETAYRIYERLGEPRLALAHLKAFKRLDDQARELAASTNAALMSAQFDFARQKTRIAQLKAGQLQRDVELSRTRNTITEMLLAGSVLIGGLLAASFLWIRRSRNQVREANAALSEANGALEKAVRARTEFLASVSHEIRTPLNGILGMTQVMLAGAKVDAEVREKLALVHGAGETMRALVDDILDIAKLETAGVVLSPSEFDLAQLCRETVEIWRDRAQAKGLALELELVAAPGRIVEDAGRLRQILFNLLSNAIKFTDAGSVGLKVDVEPALIEDPAETEHLWLTVTDTGVGIAPEQREAVFESFRQADASTTRTHGGTGLGLAICRRLAHAMGGDVILESAPGQGASVSLRVPLKRAAAPSRKATPARGLAECRVLVCDPNPLTQAVIKATLQPKVRSIECAEAGPQARPNRFDLIVADAAALGEERQARIAALRALARTAHPARIVVLTPEIGEDEAGRLLGAGAAQIVRKPISAAALADELKSGLAARAMEAPAPPKRRRKANSAA